MCQQSTYEKNPSHGKSTTRESSTFKPEQAAASLLAQSSWNFGYEAGRHDTSLSSAKLIMYYWANNPQQAALCPQVSEQDHVNPALPNSQGH